VAAAVPLGLEELGSRVERGVVRTGLRRVRLNHDNGVLAALSAAFKLRSRLAAARGFAETSSDCVVLLSIARRRRRRAFGRRYAEGPFGEARDEALDAETEGGRGHGHGHGHGRGGWVCGRLALLDAAEDASLAEARPGAPTPPPPPAGAAEASALEASLLGGRWAAGEVADGVGVGGAAGGGGGIGGGGAVCEALLATRRRHAAVERAASSPSVASSSVSSVAASVTSVAARMRSAAVPPPSPICWLLRDTLSEAALVTLWVQFDSQSLRCLALLRAAEALSGARYATVATLVTPTLEAAGLPAPDAPPGGASAKGGGGVGGAKSVAHAAADRLLRGNAQVPLSVAEKQRARIVALEAALAASRAELADAIDAQPHAPPAADLVSQTQVADFMLALVGGGEAVGGGGGGGGGGGMGGGGGGGASDEAAQALMARQMLAMASRAGAPTLDAQLQVAANMLAVVAGGGPNGPSAEAQARVAAGLLAAAGGGDAPTGGGDAPVWEPPRPSSQPGPRKEPAGVHPKELSDAAISRAIGLGHVEHKKGKGG